MLLLYNLLLTILAPVWVPWMLFRTWRRKEQPVWKERTGDYNIEPRKDRKRIWVHAVSVGEVIASTPILRETRKLLPDHEIVLTTTTSSGHRTAREQAAGLYDHLFYFPVDVNRFMAAAMQRVQPCVVAIMETELWPNFLWWAKVFDCRTLLVNGRISDRSFKRTKFFRPLYASMLANVDRCLMQTESDAQRIQALGAKSAEISGNAKIDQAANVANVDPSSWRIKLGLPFGVPVVVIGSTRGEEEERFVLEAVRQVGLDKIAVVHAPRHLERVKDLAKLVPMLGVEPALRSKGGGGSYVILDTYGELDQVFCVADIVVIGGGFANLGGQNLLQPLAQGKPVLHGPHMQNFRDVTEAADKAGAALCCKTPKDLADATEWLLKTPDERQRMGNAARDLISQSTGASARYAKAIAEEAQRFHVSQ